MHIEKRATVGNFAKKGEDIKDGDVITFASAGQVTQGTYGDQYVFLINLANGAQKNLSVNQTSLNKLIDEYGEDTEGWVGQSARVWINRENVSGKFVQVLYLTGPTKDLAGEEIE